MEYKGVNQKGTPEEMSVDVFRMQIQRQRIGKTNLKTCYENET